MTKKRRGGGGSSSSGGSASAAHAAQRDSSAAAAAAAAAVAEAAPTTAQPEHRLAFQLCIRDDAATLAQLLHECPDAAQARDEAGQTPLMRAAFHDQARALRVLLAAGVPLGARCTQGWTAMHYAAAGNAATAIQQLHSHATSLDAAATAQAASAATTATTSSSSHKNVPVATAAAVARSSTAQSLLEARTPRDETPLMVAAAHTASGALRQLLQLGANVLMADWLGRSAIDYAVHAAAYTPPERRGAAGRMLCALLERISDALQRADAGDEQYCGCCGAEGPTAPCSACMADHYCSPACRRASLGRHAPMCGVGQALRQAIAVLCTDAPPALCSPGTPVWRLQRAAAQRLLAMPNMARRCDALPMLLLAVSRAAAAAYMAEGGNSSSSGGVLAAATAVTAVAALAPPPSFSALMHGSSAGSGGARRGGKGRDGSHGGYGSCHSPAVAAAVAETQQLLNQPANAADASKPRNSALAAAANAALNGAVALAGGVTASGAARPVRHQLQLSVLRGLLLDNCFQAQPKLHMQACDMFLKARGALVLTSYATNPGATDADVLACLATLDALAAEFALLPQLLSLNTAAFAHLARIPRELQRPQMLVQASDLCYTILARVLHYTAVATVSDAATQVLEATMKYLSIPQLADAARSGSQPALELMAALVRHAAFRVTLLNSDGVVTQFAAVCAAMFLQPNAQTATWSAALLTASFMVLPQEHLHRLVFREWLDDDAVGIVKAFVNLAQAPTITKCLTFPSHNAANLAVVLESFIKDWLAVLMESTPQDATRTIIVQHVVKAEALVQPKLRMEEGQTPSFIELADRLAVVVKLLPKVPPLTLKTEAEAAETTTPTATSTTADKPVAPMKNGTKPKAADGAASTGAASTASGPVSTTKDPSSVPILHRLACSSDEADAFAATLTSQLEQAGVMFSSAATKATKEAASVVRVVDRTGFPLWFKISANRPLGRLMRTYGQLKAADIDRLEFKCRGRVIKADDTLASLQMDLTDVIEVSHLDESSAAAAQLVEPPPPMPFTLKPLDLTGSEPALADLSRLQLASLDLPGLTELLSESPTSESSAPATGDDADASKPVLFRERFQFPPPAVDDVVPPQEGTTSGDAAELRSDAVSASGLRGQIEALLRLSGGALDAEELVRLAVEAAAAQSRLEMDDEDADDDEEDEEPPRCVSSQPPAPSSSGKHAAPRHNFQDDLNDDDDEEEEDEWEDVDEEGGGGANGHSGPNGVPHLPHLLHHVHHHHHHHHHGHNHKNVAGNGAVGTGAGNGGLGKLPLGWDRRALRAFINGQLGGLMASAAALGAAAGNNRGEATGGSGGASGRQRRMYEVRLDLADLPQELSLDEWSRALADDLFKVLRQYDDGVGGGSDGASSVPGADGGSNDKATVAPTSGQ